MRTYEPLGCLADTSKILQRQRCSRPTPGGQCFVRYAPIRTRTAARTTLPPSIASNRSKVARRPQYLMGKSSSAVKPVWSQKRCVGPTSRCALEPRRAFRLASCERLDEDSIAGGWQSVGCRKQRISRRQRESDSPRWPSSVCAAPDVGCLFGSGLDPETTCPFRWSFACCRALQCCN